MSHLRFLLVALDSEKCSEAKPGCIGDTDQISVAIVVDHHDCAANRCRLSRRDMIFLLNKASRLKEN